MNVAGKSLQDIYDAGAKRLEELEDAQKSTMSDTTESHTQERMGLEPEALKEIEERCKDLDDEVRSYLARGLERIEKAVSSESEQTERYIVRLVESLTLLSKKFSETIGQLRETAESQLKDLASDSEQLYKSAAQSAHSQVHHDGTIALDDCRNDGTEAHGSVTSLLARSWDSVLEAEDEAIDNLTESFESNQGQVSQTFDNCKKEIDDKLSDKLSDLEIRAMQATEGIKITVERLSDIADRHAFDADVKLKERFSSLLYEMTSLFDEAASRAGGELVSLHESSMADLTMKSQELSREMDSLAESVNSAAAFKSAELQQRGGELVTSYTTELAERLLTSQVFHKELEAERAVMVEEIWKELGEVSEKFQKRMSSLSSTTLQKMKDICLEAENAIATAQEHCASDSKRVATEKQEAIDSTAREFVKRIEKSRQEALEAITRAAGDDGDSVADDEVPMAAAQIAADQEVAAETAVAENQDSIAEAVEDTHSPTVADPTGDTVSGAAEPRRRSKKSGKNNDKRGEGKK